MRVAATLVRSLGVGQRGLKNDRRDARALSEASCRIELPSVHIPSIVSQEVKAICVSREAMIKTRTQLVSRVRSYVRSRLGTPLRATPESLPGRVRRALLADAEGLPAHLDRLLTVLEVLSGQIADADVEIKELTANDERMQRLVTVPGAGPVMAARFVAAIDQVDRFPDASSVASYLGLIPGEKTTGFRTRRCRLTRAGAPQVRLRRPQFSWTRIKGQSDVEGGGGMVRSRREKGARSARTEGARRATGVGADGAAVGSGALAPGQRWSGRGVAAAARRVAGCSLARSRCGVWTSIAWKRGKPVRLPVWNWV